MLRMFSTHDTQTLWHYLRPLAMHLGRKIFWITLVWVILYFSTQWVAEGGASLFSLPIGVAAGFVIGWWLAEEAVDAAGFSGLVLWIILVLAAWMPLIVVEWLLGAVTGWSMGFGRWMLLSVALIMSMASAVWRASADA